MGKEKNKVIVWRPFPSPTKRETAPPAPELTRLTARPEELQSERDQAAVNRWIELADILTGRAKPKAKKKNAVA